MEKFKKSLIKAIKNDGIITVLALCLLRFFWNYDFVYAAIITTASVFTFVSSGYWLYAIYAFHYQNEQVKHYPALRLSLRVFLIILGGSSFCLVLLKVNVPYILFLFIFAASYLLTLSAFIHEKSYKTLTN